MIKIIISQTIYIDMAGCSCGLMVRRNSLRCAHATSHGFEFQKVLGGERKGIQRLFALEHHQCFQTLWPRTGNNRAEYKLLSVSLMIILIAVYIGYVEITLRPRTWNNRVEYKRYKQNISLDMATTDRLLSRAEYFGISVIKVTSNWSGAHVHSKDQFLFSDASIRVTTGRVLCVTDNRGHPVKRQALWYKILRVFCSLDHHGFLDSVHTVELGAFARSVSATEMDFGRQIC